VQIKELEKQLAEEQQRTSTSAASNSSTSTTTSSEDSGNSTCSKGDANESSKHGRSGAQQLSRPGGGSFKQQMLSKQVAWWQHAVVTGLSVVATMGYMGWEASWSCNSGGMLCAA
jgi:hypothetical protein